MFVSCGRQITYEKENSDVRPLRGKIMSQTYPWWLMSAHYVADAGSGESGVAQYKKLRVRGLGRRSRSKSKRQSSPASPCGSSTNVLATRLERRMEAAKSNCTRDKVAHSRVNHHQLLFGNWNILTLTRKELELVEKAKRYHLDIVGGSSTKRRGSGTVSLEGWVEALLFWSWSKCVCTSGCGYPFQSLLRKRSDRLVLKIKSYSWISDKIWS